MKSSAIRGKVVFKEVIKENKAEDWNALVCLCAMAVAPTEYLLPTGGIQALMVSVFCWMLS